MDALAHLPVLGGMVFHLFRHRPQLLQRWSPRRAERVVLEKLVVVQQPDFPDRRLGDKVQHVGARSA